MPINDDAATRASVWVPVKDHLEALRAADSERLRERLEHLRELRIADRDRMTEVVRRVDSTHATFEKVADRLQQASNEWRSALNDRDITSVTRVEFSTRVDGLEAKADQAASTNAALIAALGAEVQRGNAALRDEFGKGIETLRLANAERAGGRQSINDLRVWIFGAAAFVSAIIGIVGFAIKP